MQALRPVTVDLATGVVTLGGTHLTLERDGERYVAPGGRRLRALTFEERSSVVAGALIDPEPNCALLTKLRNLGNIPADNGDQLMDALVLALAGGGEAAPSFAECARTACRNAGWNWQSVQETAAVVVDQLAEAADPPVNLDGWIRFEFREAPQSPPSLEDCCREMLEQLLQRGTPQDEAPEEEANPGREFFASRSIQDARDTSGADVPDGLETGDIPRNGTSTWPSSAHSLRARAKLSPASEASSQAPTASENASPAVHIPRAIFGWSQERTMQPARAAVEPLRIRAAAENASANPPSNELSDAWVDSSGPSETRYPTLREAAVADREFRHLPSAAVPTLPVSSNLPIPTPAKARVRAHRLRDLPARGREGAPVPWGEPSTAPDVSPPTLSEVVVKDRAPQSGAPQRDWIYEIATALSDECDLRGLDA